MNVKSKLKCLKEYLSQLQWINHTVKEGRIFIEVRSCFFFFFFVAILGHFYFGNYGSYIDSTHKLIFHNAKLTILKKIVKDELHIYKVY